MRKQHSRNELDVAVIGAGPAGLVNALYLARFRRQVAVFSSGKPRAAWIPKTHNMAGFDRGISGPALLRRLRKQVTDLKVPVFDTHARLERLKQRWQITSAAGSFIASYVVLATGMEDVQPSIPNLNLLRRMGQLRYCPVCDAYEFRDRRIFVLVNDIGGLERARFLRRFSKTVHAVLLREKVASRAETRLANDAGITLHHGRSIAIEPNGGKLDLALNGISRGTFDVGYVELGSKVRDDSFAHLRGIKRGKEGFLITDKEQKLSVKGLYAAGDCVQSLSQISVAAGQAAIAACAIHGELLRKERRQG